ncbi:MAG: histidine kinase dimerization/phospho-acceptor domain-containing protein, partial [Deltaproteobacteria bacterium]
MPKSLGLNVLSRSFPVLLVLAVFLFFGGATVLFWYHQNREERELAFRHTETSAEQIVIRVEGLMKARMASLRVLAERWVERTPPDFSRDRFLQFAEDIYVHYPVFKTISWIDPEGLMRWAFPEEKNTQAKGRREILQEVGAYRPLTVTPCAPFNGEGFTFEAFIPLFHQQALQGYLEGAFEVNRIMSLCLAEDIFKDFRVRLYEGGERIYASEEESAPSVMQNRLHVVREIRFPGKIWRLDLESSPLIYSSGSVANLSSLAFGLALSAILSLLLLFLLQRMRMYKEARDQAFHEIGKRERAQEALQENEKKLESLLLELSRKNEELETFVYTVSHDLKTPIVTIEGFIGALREDFGDLLSREGEKYLTYMSDAARKMEMLINDLL